MLLSALSCVTLGVLLTAVAPRGWLKVGIVAMAAVDAYLVGAELLQPANDVLNAAAPPAHLPQLQRALFGDALIGYGDLFVAGVFGAIVAAERRGAGRAGDAPWRWALVVLALALAFDLLFLVVDVLPATVPGGARAAAARVAAPRDALKNAPKRRNYRRCYGVLEYEWRPQHSATPTPPARSGRSPLLRLQSDERLIALVRRGNHGAFEVLVGRYQARLLAFCRHMLGSREDAEDVLQEVFAAAFNAILADDRPINARPWLYRIARNRSLNHLRRVQPIGVDSMDVHLSEHGTTTADKVDKREQFRELIADVQELPETQRTALLLREIDALSYEQIAEAMETTIPSVKSLLVRARVSLAEAAEARQLYCEDVRIELGEIAEGLRRRTTPPARRHLRSCERCATFRTELRATSKALALMLPVGPLLLAKKLLLAHVGLSSSRGRGAGGAGGAASGHGGRRRRRRHGAAPRAAAGSCRRASARSARRRPPGSPPRRS